MILVKFFEVATYASIHMTSFASSSSRSPVLATRNGFYILISKQIISFSDTVKCLEAESGLKVHSHSLEVFFQSLLSGDWEACFTSINQIAFDNKSHDDIKGIILEYKFVEYLREGNVMDALTCLRTELAKKVSKERSIIIKCIFNYFFQAEHSFYMFNMS